MTGKICIRPALFMLEDDQCLQADVTNFAAQEGWDVYSSRCVEEAMEVFAKHSKDICLTFVDMMVAVHKNNLEQLKKLEREREDYIKMRFPSMNSVTAMDQSELAETRRKLSEIDQEIRKCVDFSGGEEFLKHLADNKCNCKVVVFSARLPPDEIDAIRMLRDQGRWLGWKAKPIDPLLLTDLLNTVRGVRK